MKPNADADFIMKSWDSVTHNEKSAIDSLTLFLGTSQPDKF